MKDSSVKMNPFIIKKIIRLTLFSIILAFIISGLGITNYQIIEKLTFGLLTKALSFKIHSKLLIPLLIFLIAHMSYNTLTDITRRFKKSKKL